jgi:PEP-CTERM motif
VIDAFNPTTWAFEGSIDVNPGAGNLQDGLWSLAFGGGGMDGNPNTLFFTDGINGETGGLFGSLTAVPEPSTWAMMLAGFGGLALLAARRRRASPAIG